LWLAGLLVLVAATALIHGLRRAPVLGVAIHRTPPFAVPDFALVDQRGQPLRRADLLGHVWVADFVFMECGETCSLLSRHMLDVLNRANDHDVRFVSFSIGPSDGPKDLARFERRFPATNGRWLLLAADQPTFPSLAAGMGLVKSEAGVRDGSLILFPALYLIDRDGQVRGVYDGLGSDGPRRLTSDLAALSR
jgi:protein SCO1/2